MVRQLLQTGSVRTQPTRGVRGPTAPVNTTRPQGGAGLARHAARARPAGHNTISKPAVTSASSRHRTPFAALPALCVSLMLRD